MTFLPLEHQISSLDTLFSLNATIKLLAFFRKVFKGTSVSYNSCILCILSFALYYPQFAGNEMHGAAKCQVQVFGKNEEV